MNTQKPQFILWLAVLLIALLSAAGGYSLWRILHAPQEPSMEALLQLPEPRVIADFELLNEEGERFTLADLKDQWSLLFFGFTNCPDICPSTLYDLQQLSDKLQETGQGLAPYQVVFFSVDPERDSPQQLKQYTDYFDPEFRAVTGDHKQLLPLTRQLGIAYRIEEHETDQRAYQVDHSASVLLMNPDGRLHGVFPAPHKLDYMFNDMLKILD